METGTAWVAPSLGNDKRGGNNDEDAVTVTQSAPSSSCFPLHVVSLSCRCGVSSEPGSVRFVRNELYSFPPSVPGPRTRLDPGGLKDGHGEGEAFFSITFWSPNLPL